MNRTFASLATLAMLTLVPAATAGAQEPMEKKSYNYSAWTPGIFSEAVTITNMGKGKFIFLAGVGAEDENGPRGAIRHKGDFAAQCNYAYDKIKRALAANGSKFEGRRQDDGLCHRHALPPRLGKVLAGELCR